MIRELNLNLLYFLCNAKNNLFKKKLFQRLQKISQIGLKLNVRVEIKNENFFIIQLEVISIYLGIFNFVNE